MIKSCVKFLIKQILIYQKSILHKYSRLRIVIKKIPKNDISNVSTRSEIP